MLPLPPDPWKILGVEKSSDKAEIRSAYKKLVLKCHPDKVQDPKLKAEKQEEFQKVQQAYELLNDDAERTKYEEQVQLMELRKQAALLSKNLANSSSPRTASKTYYEIRTAEIRTAEPKSKSSGGGAKVYEHYSSPHTRSHEEVTSKAYATYDDGEKHARRTASYEKPTRRDEERREKDERRRRKDDDERVSRESRERERERELQRELREREKEKERKAEKKKLRELEEKQRDKERRRDRKSPYVEDYEAREEEVYTASRLDKKRSSSRKHSEYREKSMSRREREASPAIEIIEATSKTKDQELKETAADYIARSRGNHAAPSPIFQRAQQEAFYTPPVPTPPPVDFEEESIRRSSARAAGRRSSHDSPKERVLHKQSSRDAYVVEATPSKARPIPSLSKAHSTPPVVPESPPRVSRSNTVPLQEYTRHVAQPPSFSRTQTWGGDDRRADYYDYEDSDDDHHGRHHRSRRNSRRTRSPEPSHSYRYETVERPKSSKHDHYSYGESPTSRRYPSEPLDASGSYPSTIKFTRVKESKAYGPEDVQYATHSYPYARSSGDQYSAQVYA
ncbi:hypothetical protein V8F20_006673 [Naviculisporaceae sp. PSN 640]